MRISSTTLVFCLLGGLTVSATEFAVTSNADSGSGSLREAILQANATEGPDSIVFDLESGTFITPTSELPSLTDSAGTTIRADVEIILSGLSAAGGTKGLRLESDNNVVEGLRITSFQSDGIYIAGDNNRVSGCTIGTTGSAAQPNLGSGIHIASGDGNRIGYHPDGGTGNLISGNILDGIHVALGCSDTDIAGNRIGLTAAGTFNIPNNRHGVNSSGSNTRIGGLTTPERNIISGNSQHEINLSQLIALPGNVAIIQGNWIGHTVTGDAPLYSPGSGIFLTVNADFVTVGGTEPGAGNVICCNAQHGIVVAGTFNTIQGNRIGFSAVGDTPFANVLNGVLVSGQNIRIGGDTPQAGNIIAHNSRYGIQASSQFNTFRYNSIFANEIAGIDMLPPSNDSILPPEITALSPLTGTTIPNAIVDFYADSGAQGETHIGIAQADSNGNFSAIIDLAPHVGRNLTAIATGPPPGNNSSIFSEPIAIVAVEVCDDGVDNDENGFGDCDDPACINNAACDDKHSADQNGDGAINLTELLRGVQLYAMGGLHCAASPNATEDGYIAGANLSSQSCAPHASDYIGPDWRITLPELLQLIQLYNAEGYVPCAEESGFCVAV